MNPAALSSLRAHHVASLRRGPTEYIFQTRNGTPCGDTNLLLRYLKPAGKAIGAPWLHWHSLRYTHATLLVALGASAKDLQSQMGHAQAGTSLNIYAQAVPEQQRKAVERLGHLVTNGDELAGTRLEETRPVVTIQ